MNPQTSFVHVLNVLVAGATLTEPAECTHYVIETSSDGKGVEKPNAHCRMVSGEVCIGFCL